jgi:hypothetical protein
VSIVLDAKEVRIGLNSDGCGHSIVMSQAHYDVCVKENRTWFCTVCGKSRMFVGKTQVEKLRGELAAAKQREETEKHLREVAEKALQEERAQKKKLKARIKNGVCPCCTRSFTNLREHMKTKHPDYIAAKVEKTPVTKKRSEYVEKRLKEIEGKA